MSADVLPALAAGLVAAVVVLLELVTGQYRGTAFLLRKSGWLWAYVLTYGAIAIGVMLSLQALLEAGHLKIEGLGLSDPMIRAFAVGVTIRALLNIRLFNVTVGSQQVPVGVASLLQLFEPWLLFQIELDEFNGVRSYLEPFVARYPDLVDVKKRIKGNLPPSLPDAERSALELDVDTKQEVGAAMELYLRRFGERTFKRVFPL